VDALDTGSLVARYAAWKARFPTVQPRTIYESGAVIASPHRATYSDGIR
jgi:hypothetical protein